LLQVTSYSFPATGNEQQVTSKQLGASDKQPVTSNAFFGSL